MKRIGQVIFDKPSINKFIVVTDVGIVCVCLLPIIIPVTIVWTIIAVVAAIVKAIIAALIKVNVDKS